MNVTHPAFMSKHNTKNTRATIVVYWMAIILAFLLFSVKIYDSVFDKTMEIAPKDWIVLIGCPIMIALEFFLMYKYKRKR